MHRVPRSKRGSLVAKLAHNRKYERRYELTYRFFSLFKSTPGPLYNCLDKSGFMYTEKGYTPKDLLINFTNFDYFEVKCKLPEKLHSIHACIYGEKWIVPKEKYNWMTESPL